MDVVGVGVFIGVSGIAVAAVVVVVGGGGGGF